VSAGDSRSEFNAAVDGFGALTPWVQHQARGSAAPGALAVDITALESLTAGRIEILVADAGAGVRHAGAAFYLGRQNLASGALEMTVVQGKIERLSMNGATLKSELGLRLVRPTWKGDVLRLQDLEQGIDQINRLPSNNAQLQIGPGEEPGSSVVNINNRPESRFRGLVGADDYGQQITGQGRIRLGLEADNVLGAYEGYGLSYVGSRDTNAVLFLNFSPRRLQHVFVQLLLLGVRQRRHGFGRGVRPLAGQYRSLESRA